jgi:FixJ family two-component response regulator
MRIPIEVNDDEPALQEYHTNGELFEVVSFQDVLSTVGRHLKPRERRVLGGLADGLMLREIASELRVSYPTALKSRRTIATVVTKLGISPMLNCGTEPLGGLAPGKPQLRGEKKEREKSQNHSNG